VRRVFGVHKRKDVNSCLCRWLQVEGAEIKTIEGITTDNQLHAVQQAFIECGGAQCGICTPGMCWPARRSAGTQSKSYDADIRTAWRQLCRCNRLHEDFRVRGAGVSGALKSS